MNGLTVSFDEYVYRFDDVNGWWICEQDDTTLSTGTLLRWLKHDADESHRRTKEKAQ